MSGSSNGVYIFIIVFLLMVVIRISAGWFLTSKDLKDELAKIEEELETKKNELIQKTKQVTELEKKTTDTTAQSTSIAEKDAQIIKLKAEIDSLGVRISTYNTFVTSLKANLARVSSGPSISLISNEIEKYNTILTAIDAVLADKDNAIRNLNNNATDKANQDALSSLLSGGKKFTDLESDYKKLTKDNTELTTAVNNIVNNINSSLTNITIAENTNGSINMPNAIIIDNRNINTANLAAVRSYISVTRKLINDMITKIGSTDEEKKTGNYDTGKKVMDLLDKYIAATNTSKTNYEARIAQLELELSRFRITGNRIPISFLKDTILFGLDIKTYRPEFTPGALGNTNQGYVYEPRHTAQNICDNDRYCASTTFSSPTDMVPFEDVTNRSIQDRDAANSYDMCPTNEGIISTIYEAHVEALNTADRDKCPKQRIRSSDGQLLNIYGKRNIKLADLNAEDQCKDVVKNWTFTVGCTKPVGVLLNAAHDGTSFKRSPIAEKTAQWNVGIVKPHYIDWGSSIKVGTQNISNPFDYQDNLKTLDFSKLNNGSSGSSGVLFRNTDLGGSNLGQSIEVKSLQECVNHLNNTYSNIPTKAAVISKDPVSNWKYVCQPRGKVPASASTASTPAVPEQNIKLFRNIGSNQAWDTYVPSGVVPDFDFNF
jgi:hypothetical protein